jgi:hypothetical protein
MRTELLASQRTRSIQEQAEQMRYGRRVLALRRARRHEQKAERRMVEAWRRTAELHSAVESLEY